MTYSPDKFSLKWTDFGKNIVSSYADFRKEPYFSDVTLVCQEDLSIEAHRIILTSCSPFFSNLLRKNKHSHAMLYMRGLKAKELKAIVDFIYHGEAHIFQEDLDRFLALAEEFQLKGLSGSYKEDNNITSDRPSQETISNKNIKTEFISIEASTFEAAPFTDDSENLKNIMVPVHSAKSLVTVDTELEDLEARINSMIEEVSDGINNRRCTVCGKTTKCGAARRAMTRHIETHIEGVSHTCSQCGKVARSLPSCVSPYHKTYRKLFSGLLLALSITYRNITKSNGGTSITGIYFHET